GLPESVVESALLQIEAEGQVLRGRFTAASAAPDSEIEWCNRRVLARIHRLTLGRLRREIEPVTARDFMRFLYQWQHLKNGSWLLEAAAGRAAANGPAVTQGQGLSDGARQVLDSLSRRGASFLADLVRDTRQLTSVVEDALWELAAAGLVTADGFENLRALIDPKRRLATARHHARRARFVPGRWALLRCQGSDPMTKN